MRKIVAKNSKKAQNCTYTWIKQLTCPAFFSFTYY